MTTTARAPAADHHVKAAVLAELDWLASVDAARIGVSVDGGAVTLTGQVGSYPEQRAAVRAAFRVKGVTAVADEIRVHSPWTPRDDTDIAQAVAFVLEQMTTTEIGPVQAEVEDHVVTLTGNVAWNYQREAVQRAITLLPGVHGVTGNIVLRPDAHVSPATAKDKIAEALRRNATIRAEHMTVEVDGDTVTLRGTVGSRAERRQAEHAASSAPGVTEVVNELRITR